MYEVQEMLGHAEPRITLDVYGERWKRSGEEHAERMEPAIRGALAIRPQDARVVGLR